MQVVDTVAKSWTSAALASHKLSRFCLARAMLVVEGTACAEAPAFANLIYLLVIEFRILNIAEEHGPLENSTVVITAGHASRTSLVLRNIMTTAVNDDISNLIQGDSSQAWHCTSICECQYLRGNGIPT
jgi:hypothetical protein